MRQLLNIRHASLTEAYFADLGPLTKFSLALDCWSSPNKKAFIASVAYYVSETLQYKEVLLGFEPLHGAHTGRNLAQVVERVLLHFGIADRLFAITTDNASNNGTL